MRYASMRSLDISNGEGVGVSLFVQGCLRHCKNCFNPETWSMAGGQEFTAEIRKEFLELVSRSYITRVTFIGGEPLLNANLEEITSLSQEIKNKYPDKKQWLYTGYKWEDIMKDPRQYNAIQNLDVLIDGEYIDELRDHRLIYRGSRNQRVIDVQASLSNDKILLLNRECEL